MTRFSNYRIAFGAVLVAAFVSAAGMLLQAEPPQAVGTWASIGATPDSRIGAAAVALADGRTLIAGGSIQGTPTDTVVIFNPADGSFASAGQLLAPRVGHTATLLDDGRVLIVGGTVAGLLRNDLELFDPSSGTSEPSATMPQPRSGHAAARLADGTVLIAGGTTTDGVVLQTAEIFDPSTGSTTPTTLPMLMPRTRASATTLIDGRVLIAGGSSNGSADLASAEIYQPWSQLFEAVDTGMSVARSGHAAVLLPWNNSVLIAGGSSDGVAQLTSDLFLPAEFPDPYSYGIGHFGPTGSMAAPRVRAVATPHIEGYAVAMGGGAADAEVYRFATIKTDKDDYAPGVKAIITGSGWQPLEDVTLLFQEDPAVHDDYVLHVMADSEGNIVWDQWAPEEHDLNVRFYLMAKQATPQGERRAQTTFTDARNFTLTFSGSGTGSVTLDTTTGIHSGTFKVPASCGGTNSNISSWTFTSTCTSISLNDNDATGTLTATSNAGSAFAGWSAASAFTGCTSTSPCSFSVTGSNPAITTTFNVATKLAFGQQPTNTQVGATISPALTVRILDAANNLANDTRNVTLAIGTNPSSGTLSGTTTVAAVAGVATFSNLSINHAGNGYTLVASSSPALTGATSSAFNIAKANQTITFGALGNKTYGDPDFSVSATASSGLAVSFSSQTLPVCTVSGTTVHIVAQGLCTIRASQAGNADYNPASPNVDQSFAINKANAVVVVTPYSVTYDSLSHSAAITSITGVNGDTGATVGTVDVSNTTHTAAGTYSSDSWSFTGTANYNNIAATTITDTINKANAVVVVTPYTVAYDGLSHTATVASITGVAGQTGATVGTVDVSNTAHTDAGIYSSDSWSFTGTANYNNIAATTITDTINKANAVVVVTPYSVAYDGLSHTATVASITGVAGQTGATVGTVDVSNTTHTDAGIYSSDSWSFTGTANYNNIAATTITDTINKANAVVVVTPYTVAYDGLSHTATVASITGVAGQTGATVGTVDVSNTAHMNAGIYSSDSWSFTGTANYNNIAATTITDTIAKADAVVVVTPYSVTYDGLSHSAAITSITGVNGETGATVGTVDVSNTTHTDAGIYSSDSWSFTGTANYNNIAATPITDTIAKADAGVVVTPYNVTYDGLSHSAAITSVTGVNGETGATVGTVDVSNTAHLNAGIYSSDSWSFTGTGNYNNIAATTITDTINKAVATVTVNGYTGTYDAAAHGASGSATGVDAAGAALGSTLDLGASFTNVPGGTANWNFTGGTNYTDQNGTAAIVINKAVATVTVNGYTGTYDAAAHGASGSATGVDAAGAALGSTLDLGASFTNVPGGTANWNFTGGTNYTDQNGTAAIVINKAVATVSVNGYTGTYDAAPHGATGSATGVDAAGAALGSTLDLGASFTNVPGGTANWNFTGGTNYTDQNGTAAIVINKAVATVTVNGYSGTYDAAPHGATGSATGVDAAGAALGSTLDLGASFTNVPGGTATWTFTGGTNYTDQTGPAAIVINKAVATVSVNGYMGTYDAAPHGATGSATGVDAAGAALGSTLDLGASFTNVPGGTATWTFTGGTNYTDQTGPAAIVINKAVATVSVNGYTGTYDAAPHGATGSATGVDAAGAALGSTLDLGASFTNVPGGTATWTFTGGTNYTDQTGPAAIVINKAVATVSVNGYTGTYDAAPHGATGSATGVDAAGAALGSTLDLGASFTNVPGGTATWTFTGGTNYTDQSGTAAIVISKAAAVVTVNGYTGVYDAAAHGASGTATGVGSVDLSAGLNFGATFTSVPGGTANWTFTGGTNYTDQNGTAAIVISKANAVVTVNGYTGVYDAAAHGASGTATGVGSVDLSAGLNFGATFTSVPGGTANWTFAGGTNYNDQSGAAAIVISKADATVVVNGYTGVYDAAAHGASGTATGVGSVDLSAGLNFGATFTSVPGGTANWTFAGGTNYNDQSGTAAIVINKANATVTVNGYTGVYDAAAHGASGTATGVGSVDLSAGLNFGATFTSVPGGTANWTFAGGTNYNDQSGAAAIVINKANATVTVNGYTGVYDAAAHGASGTATGVGSVDLSAGLNFGATFTNVPGGTANWTFAGGTNYNDQSGTATIVINKANATVTVTPYNVIYDGASHTAVGTAKGVMLESLSGLALGGTTHIPAGDYLTDPWTFTDVTGNYNNASLTVHDRITYSTGACLGQPGHQILQPINADGTSVVKKGSTVPAKFRVCDINGNSVGTPGVVTSFQLIQTTAGTVVNYITEEVLSTTPDSSFRWDSTDKQWIFNVSTKNLSPNVTYKYAITLNDGSVINFQFGAK